ncbi:MAG: four helix bundle protein [Deltaproteobacteria bacterium]|nr:four helix bundle protein [Deltaproteobacteria bacterium]
MRDHTKLRAFQLADELALEIYRVTADFPTSERFGLASQLRRCGVSIASNIVEGCARKTQAEYARFIEVAFGSAKELQYELSLVFRLGYLKRADSDPVSALADETAAVLAGLLKKMGMKQTA